MKTLKISGVGNSVVAVVISVGFLAHCSKSEKSVVDPKTDGSGDLSLSLSNSTVDRGQPLQAQFAGGMNATAVVRWSVTPSTGNQIFTASNNSTILFAVPGRYAVTAREYADSNATTPLDSTSSPVNVSDSIYTPPAAAPDMDTASLNGDQLVVTPQISGDSVLVLQVRTVNSYNCIPQFVGYSENLLHDTLTANFNYITNTQSSNCGGSKSQAGAYVFFGGATSGTYQIDIEFNHQYYFGSVTVTGSTYAFTWPYSRGVIFSTLEVQRQ